MTDLIKEFFFDGISRILPGFVFIFLYFRRIVVEVLNGTDEQVILKTILLIAFAWIIGIVLETITFVFPAIFLWSFSRKKEKKWKCLKKWPTWNWASFLYKKLINADLPVKDDAAHTRRLIKGLAEKTFFRHMWFISLCTMFCWPTSFSCNNNSTVFLWPQWFWHSHFYVSITAFSIFFGAWIWALIGLQIYLGEQENL